MTCIHNLDEIQKFECKMFVEAFQINENYLFALISSNVENGEGKRIEET